MANILQNIKLNTNLDDLYLNNSQIDILGENTSQATKAEDLIQKISDSDQNVPSSNLIKKIIMDIIVRLNNIEVWMDAQWKQTSFMIENVDSIDRTEVKVINLNSEE